MAHTVFDLGKGRVCVIAPDYDYSLVFNGTCHELFFNNRVVALFVLYGGELWVKSKNGANAKIYIDGARMPDTEEWAKISSTSVIQLFGNSVVITSLGVVAQFLCGDVSNGLALLAQVASSAPGGPVSNALNLWHMGLYADTQLATPLIRAIYETIGTLVGYRVEAMSPDNPDDLAEDDLVRLKYWNGPGNTSYC